MTTTTAPLRAEQLDKLEALAKAATPQNLDSAEDSSRPTGYIECPECGGEGTVELTADYCNYDGKAMGVQFYGIGPEHRAAEAFFRAVNPATILALIAQARAAQSHHAAATTQQEQEKCAPPFAAPASQRDAILSAVIKCGHSITDGVVKLYANPKLPGNALSQLADRLEEELTSRCRAQGGNANDSNSGAAATTGEDARDAALRFVNEAINAAFDGGGFDGGDIQDLAVKLGLLKLETMSEPCGESCRCAEGVPFFPAECYRKTYLAAMSAPNAIPNNKENTNA